MKVNLRAEVEAAVLAEVERAGGTGKIARAPFAAVVLNPSDDPTHLPKWDPCDPEIGP